MFKQYKSLSREVYIICLSRFIVTLGAFIGPLFIIILKSKLNFNNTQVTIFIVVATILGIIAKLAGGIVSDKFGNKRTIVIFQSLAILTYILTIFIPFGITTAYILVLGMIFFGISHPAGGALLAKIAKTEERESAYSLNYLALNLGVIIGPAVGGFLIRDHFKLFITIDVITTLAGLILLIILVKEPKDDLPKENKFEERKEGSFFQIFKERPIIFYFTLLLIFNSMVYSQFEYTLPLYLEQTVENYEQFFGIVYSLNGLVVVLFTAVVTAAFSKKTSMQKTKIGLVLYSIAIFGYAIIVSKMGILTLVFIFTIGEIVLTIGIAPIMSKIVPSNMMSRASGLVSVCFTLGRLFTTIITGALLAIGLEFKYIWLIFGIFSALCYLYCYIFSLKFKNNLSYIDQLDNNRTI